MLNSTGTQRPFGISKGVRPKPFTVSHEALVTTGELPETGLPLLVQPAVEGVSLHEWAGGNRAMLEGALAERGAILFRGFKVETAGQFEQFVRSVSDELIEYGERSSPRTNIGGRVYTSTDHPPEQPILLHNEQSYTLDWPMKISFYCARPAREGGRTPIADSRKIYRRLDPAVVSKFERNGVLYVRNYGDGLGLPWPEVFGTNDRAEVEGHCRRASIECVWKGDGRLQTRQVRPAVRRHPRTGETVWFNHATFFHLSSLGDAAAREAMLAVVGEEGAPYNTFYGDGSPIEPPVLEELRAAYRLESESFVWQEQDILLLDNMLTAHGREPFAGPRKVLVAMADPFSRVTKSL
jgi:alpha-ketoglutarate-dependent taurine dioxygenase